MLRFVFLVFTLVYVSKASAQEAPVFKKDLKDQWLTFEKNSLNPIDDNTKVDGSVHFSIETNQYPGESLLIRSANSFFLFVNGRLYRHHRGQLTLPVDSLRNRFGNSVTFSVYQNKINVKDLTTVIAGPASASNLLASDMRPLTFFRDFVTLAGLLLIIFFVSMLKVHPKLVADYFSFTRILSLREVEDTQTHARFAISANFLFYIFCSLIIGLYFMILFYHLPDKFLLPLQFKASSFIGAVAQWLKLSVSILLMLSIKILLIFLLSALFGLRGIAGLHFFNWIRLLLIIMSSLSVIVFVYFVSRGTNGDVYVTFLSITVAVLIAWVVVIFLKLNNRSEHSMFHLFSYICATEVIPLLLTIKVLFN